MQNPWFNLPETAPFVLDCDKTGILAFNRTAREEYRIHLEVLPEPYTGNPEANIILLGLNPGYYERNEAFGTGDAFFWKTSRANLVHANREYPFYLLDPRNEASPGYYWWSRKLKQPIARYGLEKVAREFCVIEYFPYHSKNFGYNGIIPSQRYNFSLIQEAMGRKAIIIQMRNRKRWLEALPELANYSHYYTLKNWQNPTISENNCPEGFAEIRKLLG